MNTRQALKRSVAAARKESDIARMARETAAQNARKHAAEHIATADQLLVERDWSGAADHLNSAASFLRALAKSEVAQ